MERAATQAIERAIAAIAPTWAIASAARGGDILFLESCRRREIRTTIVLPFPVAEFERQSVSGVGNGHWERRFRKLVSAAGPSQVVQIDTAGAPHPFRACNEAMLDLARGSDPTPTLLALWDGKDGDGPGGTAEMVDAIRRLGGEVIVIAPASLQDAAQRHA